MKPLVSILIPCHNAGPWLRATLESVVAQTWPACETIVVDDGSTDDSARIATEFNERGVRLVRQQNRGQSAAFNAALAQARGDFYEFLDADDLLAPDKLEQQIRQLANQPPDTLCSGAWARFRDDPTEARFTPEPIWCDLAPIDWLITSWEGGGMMHGAAWLVPATVARRAGLWTESLTLTNDFDYFTRVVLASSGIKFCGEARTYYRSGNTSSLSNAKSRAALQSAYESIRLGTAELLQREDSPRTRHAAAVSYMRFVQSYYPQHRDLLAAAEARARELGGCHLPATGGKTFLVLSRLLGWKCARHLQRAWFSRRPRRSL